MRSSKASRKKCQPTLVGLSNSNFGAQDTKDEIGSDGLMSNVRIENPILNSPYEEPKRHFDFQTKE